MSILTDEERQQLWDIVIPALGKLYQDAMHAPALTLAQDSEVKKSKKAPRIFSRTTSFATVLRSFRVFLERIIPTKARGQVNNRMRQKRHFWNLLKRSYPGCQNFLELFTS